MKQILGFISWRICRISLVWALILHTHKHTHT